MVDFSSSVGIRWQGFQDAGGTLEVSGATREAWVLSALEDYDARQPTNPRGSRIHKALHAPADHTLVGAFDADGTLVGAMSYRTRQNPTDLFVTSLGSTGALPGTGVALLAHLALVSIEAGLGVRASLDPIALGFYQSLGWKEIEVGDPGHKWYWPKAARQAVVALLVPAVVPVLF